MKKQVLGIKIDDINIDQALEVVKGWLSKGGKHYIVTPNPEILVMAQKDEELKKVINKADLTTPDGVGLRLSGDIVCNTPGIDLMEAIIKYVSEKGLTIGLLGGRDKVAEEVAKRLSRKYPNLKISFARSGDEVDQMGNVLSSKYYGKKHNTKYIIPNTDLLFVAFGPPKQEKWIAKNLTNLDVKVAMGVGGAFDYLSGRVPRAPKWFRNIGLEWLFRLIVQPRRIKRQTALLKYLFLLARSNLKG